MSIPNETIIWLDTISIDSFYHSYLFTEHHASTSSIDMKQNATNINKIKPASTFQGGGKSYTPSVSNNKREEYIPQKK